MVLRYIALLTGGMVAVLAIEILGFTLKPELSIGDIVGVAALLVAALTFYIGHTRSKKSEQITMSREIWARIEEKAERLQRSVEEARNEVRVPPSPPDYKIAMNTMGSLLAEVRYLTYLMYREVIDDLQIRLYYQLMLDDLKNDIESLCKKYNIYGELKWNEFTEAIEEYKTISFTTLGYLRRHPLRATQAFTTGFVQGFVKGFVEAIKGDVEKVKR